MPEEKKRGFIARRVVGTGRYVGRRVGNRDLQKVGFENFRTTFSGARKAIKPIPLDMDEVRSGLGGRYEDGGVSRFREMVAQTGLDHHELMEIASKHRRSALIMFMAAAAFVGYGTWMILHSETVSGVFYGLSTAFASLIFAGIGIQKDFSRWQITVKRFGGFREYLAGAGPATFAPKETSMSKFSRGEKR